MTHGGQTFCFPTVSSGNGLCGFSFVFGFAFVPICSSTAGGVCSCGNGFLAERVLRTFPGDDATAVFGSFFGGGGGGDWDWVRFFAPSDEEVLVSARGCAGSSKSELGYICTSSPAASSSTSFANGVGAGARGEGFDFAGRVVVVVIVGYLVFGEGVGAAGAESSSSSSSSAPLPIPFPVTVTFTRGEIRGCKLDLMAPVMDFPATGFPSALTPFRSAEGAVAVVAVGLCEARRLLYSRLIDYTGPSISYHCAQHRQRDVPSVAVKCRTSDRTSRCAGQLAAGVPLSRRCCCWVLRGAG